MPTHRHLTLNHLAWLTPYLCPHGQFSSWLVDPWVRTIVRHIHSRVVMNYHTARAMLEWLEDKIVALEAEEEGGVPPITFDDGGFQHQ